MAIFDRLDGSKTNLKTGNAFGVLAQTGLDFTMSDHVAEIDFSSVNMPQIDTAKYVDLFRVKEGIESAGQSGSTLLVATKPGAQIDSHEMIARYVLGKAISSGDKLGQAADAAIQDMSERQADIVTRPVSVAGAGSLGVSGPEAIM